MSALAFETAEKQRLKSLHDSRDLANRAKKEKRQRQKQESEDLEQEFDNEEDQGDDGDSSTMTLEQVIAAHQPQLEGMQLPLSLWPTLITKLAQQTMDAGTAFGYTYDDTESSLHLRYDVQALKACTKEQDVWIVPHIWSFPNEEFAVDTLATSTDTALRMATLMGKEDLVSKINGLTATPSSTPSRCSKQPLPLVPATRVY